MKLPFLGFGLGLRPQYYEEIIQCLPVVDWFEITTENYLIPGGKPLYYLDKIRERYPLVMHGVSLSLGSTEPLNQSYLSQLKQLATRVQPAWISDHLCWIGVNGLNMHDLLPLPYTEEALNHVVSRILQVQDYLQQPIVIENVSSYLTFSESEMSEWDFIREIIKLTDCYLLLDVNNVYVSSINHNFNAMTYINALPKNKIAQIHLAGHSNHGNYIVDTHNAPVIQAVWDLYTQTVSQLGLISTMIERDDNMPPLAELLVEMERARTLAYNVVEGELMV